MARKTLKDLQEKLELPAQDKELLRQALTHSSHMSAHYASYERLEFLGDRILGLIIAQELYNLYPTEPEGLLSRRFVDLVRKETLAQVAEQMGLDEHIRLSRAEEQAGGQKKMGVLADVCEALLAAVYLSQGFEVTKNLVLRWWQPYLKSNRKPPRDPKTALQEWAQSQGKPLPFYTEISRDGPDHNPSFIVEASVEGYSSKRGTGHSKRKAEQRAAYALLQCHAPEIHIQIVE